MRFPALLTVLPALLLLAPLVRADDTDDFLDQKNWEGREGVWTMEKGVITGVSDGKLNGTTFNCTKKKYSDFELSFKVKLDNGVGDSGVQFRSTRRDEDKNKNPENSFRVKGPQVDIHKGYWGSLWFEDGQGDMIKAVDSKKAVTDDKGVNEFTIRVEGSKIKVTVNKETLLDAPDISKISNIQHDLSADGIIAIQMNDKSKKMKVEFTDIKFTDLSKKK